MSSFCCEFEIFYSVGHLTQKCPRRVLILDHEVIFYLGISTLRYILATANYMLKKRLIPMERFVSVVHFFCFSLCSSSAKAGKEMYD